MVFCVCRFLSLKNNECNAIFFNILFELVCAKLNEIVRTVAKKLKIYAIFFVDATNFFFGQLAVEMLVDFFLGNHAVSFDIQPFFGSFFVSQYFNKNLGITKKVF